MPEMNASSTVEPVDFRSLVAHRQAVPAEATVEQVQAVLTESDVDFLAILDGDRLIGVAARRVLADSLGSRFGFALNAKRPVREHLLPAPLVIATGAALTDVFRSAAARDSREFYDDVVLVDPAGIYVGMIPVRRLVQLQTEFLLGNIARLETSQREVAEKTHQIENDLRMAHEVQMAMLPRAPAPFVVDDRRVRFCDRYVPAGDMSGDFFDVFPISSNTVGILVCDVMGHGVRSALITAMVRAMMESLHEIAGEPGRFLTQLNRSLTSILRQTGSLIFVTAAYATIDLGAQRLRYAQAGHPTPFRSDGATASLRTIGCSESEAGPALGLIDDFEFLMVEEPFLPGDRVFFFTDGLFEAIATNGEEFGLERLQSTLQQHVRMDIDQWLDRTVATAAHFSNGKFGDDLCLVAAEFESRPHDERSAPTARTDSDAHSLIPSSG